MPKTKNAMSKKKQKVSKFVGPKHDPEFYNQIKGPSGEEKTKVCPPYFLHTPDYLNTDVYELLDFQGVMGFLSRRMTIDFALVDYFCRHVRIIDDEVWDWGFELKLHNGDEFAYNSLDFYDDFGLNDLYEPNVSYFHNFPSNIENNWPPLLTQAGYGDKEELVRKLNHLDEYEEISTEMTNSVNTKFLSGNDKILLMVIRRIIHQTNNKDDVVSLPNAILLALIKSRVRINIPYLIIQTLKNSLPKAHNDSYPYGGWITQIMKDWEIIVAGPSVTVKDPLPINRRCYLIQNSEKVGTTLINLCEWPYLSRELKVLYRKEQIRRNPKNVGNAPVISSESEEHQGGDDEINSANMEEDGEDESENIREEIRSKMARDRNSDLDELRDEVRVIRTDLGELRSEVHDLRTETRNNHKSIMDYLRILGSKLGCASPERKDVHDPSTSA